MTPWTAARQAPLSMGSSKQEYWSGLPFPSPGHLLDPGIEPGSLRSSWVFKSFPGGSDGKVSACNAGDPGSIPGLGRSPGKGNGNPRQYSCQENPMDRGSWQATDHGVSRVRHGLGHKPSAAAAAKPLQSCPTLCDPRDGSPPGSPVPGILQARTLDWVAISSSNA